MNTSPDSNLLKFYSAGLTFLLALFSQLIAPQQAHAKAQYFSCINKSGIPTTVANMSSGKQVEMIRWTSSIFTDDGWTPERRCQEVSGRFTEYNNKNQLRYLTTGKINGMHVICVALNKGDRCSNLVYTLKPGQNPTQTLNRLFGIQRKATGPLNETGDRAYIDINEYLGIGKTENLPAMTTGDKLNDW